ncbi:MAG: hypothetical protein IBX55_09140 [Methyloprofundus sp.]|nr:hypothetical protein [Methyloprofundus sp.]MBW6452226.1 hypothetical protein [Methyloprofundus sp.]
MKKKFLTPILFIAALIGLIMFQKEAVMPFAKKVVSSDLFLVDSEDKGSPFAGSTTMTNYAFMQCNKEIREKIDSETNITFPAQPLQSWSLGNYRYIINAEIELSPPSGAAFFKKYACQIQYEEESNLEAVMDSDNWSVTGISGL